MIHYFLFLFSAYKIVSFTNRSKFVDSGIIKLYIFSFFIIGYGPKFKIFIFKIRFWVGFLTTLLTFKGGKSILRGFALFYSLEDKLFTFITLT
jgi:hypothetical protein